MGRRKRPTYTNEFKAEAVRLARKGDKSVGGTASGVGISETALRSWMAQAEIDEGNGPAGALTTEERQELTLLRRELRQVTLERDFLKKSRSLRVPRWRPVVAGSLAELEMREGPSRSGCRARSQTTSCCVGKEPSW